MTIILSIIFVLLLNFLKLVNSAVWTVLPSNFSDFEVKLGEANDGDTILLPPGNYIGKENDEWPTDDDSGNPKPKNICDMVSSVNPNLIIRGSGNNPSQVKIIGIVIQYCYFYLVLENLSTYFCGTESAIESDDDRGLILRNVIINTSYASRYGIDMMSNRIGIIDSKIRAYPPLPNVGRTGLVVEGSVTMINSHVEGYKYGVELGGLDRPNPSSKDYKVYKNKWGKNTQGCKHTRSSKSSQTCTQALSQITPNTPASKSSYNVNQFIDILRYSNYPSGGPYIPIVIKYPKVLRDGETTIYRLPSAYPEPPSSDLTSALHPQYFRFDCTAKLGKKAIVTFNKTVIDSAFDTGKIEAYIFKSGSWELVRLIVAGNEYAFPFPNKQLRGLIAFFKTQR